MTEKIEKENENLVSRPVISQYTIQRLPFYLDYLKKKQKEGMTRISSPMIARDLELNEVQVKKDLSAVTTQSGKPKTGHQIENLINDLESFLGYHNETKAILVGAGNLGKALLSFGGFSTYGLNIAAAFDHNPRIVGNVINKIEVFDMADMEEYCKNHAIHIGIITVGGEVAQKVADMLVECGVMAIWNFAPVHLSVPEDIIIQNENMACSLAVLSHRLQQKIEYQESKKGMTYESNKKEFTK
jgi:redox-sensing transcriptional repressor